MSAYRSHSRLKQTALVVSAVPCTVAPVSRSSHLKKNSMASRRGPSQAEEDAQIIRERLAKERARLQAVAEQNRQRIAQAKREREEAAKAAGTAPAKAARTGAKTPYSATST